jgi:hypothetical protein
MAQLGDSQRAHTRLNFKNRIAALCRIRKWGTPWRVCNRLTKLWGFLHQPTPSRSSIPTELWLSAFTLTCFPVDPNRKLTRRDGSCKSSLLTPFSRIRRSDQRMTRSLAGVERRVRSRNQSTVINAGSRRFTGKYAGMWLDVLNAAGEIEESWSASHKAFKQLKTLFSTLGTPAQPLSVGLGQSPR